MDKKPLDCNGDPIEVGDLVRYVYEDDRDGKTWAYGVESRVKCIVMTYATGMYVTVEIPEEEVRKILRKLGAPYRKVESSYYDFLAKRLLILSKGSDPTNRITTHKHTSYPR